LKRNPRAVGRPCGRGVGCLGFRQKTGLLGLRIKNAKLAAFVRQRGLIDKLFAVGRV
jgi:hypothetical protein